VGEGKDDRALEPGDWELVSGNEVQLKDDTFKFGDGEATVRVFKNASVKNERLRRSADSGIWIQFTSRGQLMDKDTHVLQFIHRYWVNAATGKPFDPFYYQTKKEDGTLLWREANPKNWSVDSESLTDIYYDSSGGAHRKSAFQIAIFDRPGIDQEDRYSKVGAVFDTFLVRKNKVYYHLHWERIGVKTDGKWKLDYMNIKGEPIADGKLPTNFDTEKFLLGYKTNEGKRLVGKIELPNPIGR
jgi:hypothetical protein